jgi:hypothetical protein
LELDYEYVTVLIIRKLLECGPTIPGGIQPHILTRIASIFFETGLIYTLSVVLSLGIYLTGSNLEYVVSLAVGLPVTFWMHRLIYDRQMIHIVVGYLLGGQCQDIVTDSYAFSP